MSAKANAGSWFWWLLVLLPPAAAIYLLAPGLGEFEQGFWPEFLGVGIRGTTQYSVFAAAVRFWTGAALIVATVIAVVSVWRLIVTWRSRLRALSYAKSSHYRRTFFFSTLLVLLFAAACSAIVMLPLATSYALLPTAAWVWFVAFGAVFGACQFIAFAAAYEGTRRLFRG